MTDIVERLRLRGTGICCEAADEIERLRTALNGRIEAATDLQMECDRLRRIAGLYRDILGDVWDELCWSQGGPTDPPTGAPDPEK